MARRRTRWLALLALTIVTLAVPASSASALAPGATSFQRTWARTDQVVAAGQASRTWMWGPAGFSALMREPYDESPGGFRNVQYFDKSRMEITHPDDDPGSIWYVTNGLLVRELITGELQLGDDRFDTSRDPARMSVAGDPDDTSGPTYATFTAMLSLPPLENGAPVVQRLTRDGGVSDEPGLADYGATAAYLVDVQGLRHQVASPFWAFMTATGAVFEDGRYVTDLLFENPFYATGYPITEAYWAHVKVRGTTQDVLVQCFERRCLTWTPGNAPEWRVEMGNVGQHYYSWRYGADIPGEPPVLGTDEHLLLGPAPLLAWPFAAEGKASIDVANKSPYTMRVRFEGPESLMLRIDPCPGCTQYPPGSPPPSCDDANVGSATLTPGNYRVTIDFQGVDQNVIPGQGHWTLVPDGGYAACYYVVDDAASPQPRAAPSSIGARGSR